jgi:hypothetical protein
MLFLMVVSVSLYLLWSGGKYPYIPPDDGLGSGGSTPTSPRGSIGVWGEVPQNPLDDRLGSGGKYSYTPPPQTMV